MTTVAAVHGAADAHYVWLPPTPDESFDYKTVIQGLQFTAHLFQKSLVGFRARNTTHTLTLTLVESYFR